MDKEIAMLRIEQIKQVIEECRELGEKGLDNGVSADIPDMIVDVVNPPADFLGANGNPAVFVNQKTFNLLGSLHSNWVVNKTIALKEVFLSETPIKVIGAIIHETGHAFCVFAKIPNSETNAYVFEIEVLLKLIEMKSPLLSYCSTKDIQSYFNSRLSYYNIGASSNEHLVNLIKLIKDIYDLESTKISSQELKKMLLNQFINERFSLFASKPWKQDRNLLMSQITVGLEIKLMLFSLAHRHDMVFDSLSQSAPAA
jgi:hypothetical protein